MRNPGAAVRAISALWKALEQIEAFPEIGQPTNDRGIRQVRVRFGRRGYVLRYAVLPSDGTIFVTRVWHAREARE